MAALNLGMVFHAIWFDLFSMFLHRFAFFQRYIIISDVEIFGAQNVSMSLRAWDGKFKSAYWIVRNEDQLNAEKTHTVRQKEIEWSDNCQKQTQHIFSHFFLVDGYLITGETRCANRPLAQSILFNHFLRSTIGVNKSIGKMRIESAELVIDGREANRSQWNIG